MVRRPLGWWAAAALIIFLVVVAAPLTRAAPAPAGATLSLGSSGTLTAGLTVVVANGSALRYAMDGYFGPLVAELPGTNSSRAALLATINAMESDPLFAGLFGDHDGRVDSTVDVPRFERLVLNEAKLIPVSDFSGLLNLTLDGKGPLSDQLANISFSNAPGPDNSTAPIGITATLTLAFSWSGTGSSHTFEISWNLPSILGNLTVSVPNVNVSFRTPAAVTITSVQGLTATQISNDPFGWGAASASGQYTPLPGHTIVIRFGPSFPTGDVLIGGVVAAAALGGLGFLLLRRRRRKTSPSGEKTGPDSGVGPSSGSG